MRNVNHNTSLKLEQVDHFALTWKEQLDLHVKRISAYQTVLNQVQLRQKIGEQVDVIGITSYIDKQVDDLQGELLLIQTKMDLERQAIEDLKKKSPFLRWGMKIVLIIFKIADVFRKKKKQS